MRWKSYEHKAGKAAWGDIVKDLEWAMKVLQGEIALAKEIIQVGPELESNSLNRHVWSMFYVAWHRGENSEKKGKVCFALMQPINLGWRIMYVVHFHNIKYYKRKV